MRSSTTLRFASCVLLSMAAACSDSETTSPVPVTTPPVLSLDGPFLEGSCDPLVPSHCGFPFPSNVYLVADKTTPSGHRVAFGDETLPRLYGTTPVKPGPWSDLDGFSPGQSALVDLPGAVATGLPTQDDIEASLGAESPTILIDAETGERIPHFAEIDVSTDVQADDDHTFIVRPVVRLKDSTRYIVAIRRVVDASGNVLAPSPAFAALRDGTKHDDPSIDKRRDLYADIFGRLEKAGIPKTDLQIAWDYTTASRESTTRAMLHMRDEALAIVGDDGPEYVIDSVEEDPNPQIKRRIHGHMTVPSYLDDPAPGGKLVYGEDGLPKLNGTADFEFLVHIPNAATHGTPGALLQNGHGLLGDKGEGENGYLADLADKKNFVAFGVDFVGMADPDYDTVVASVLGDIGKFKGLVGRQHQGMLNSLLAMRMMKGRFWKDPQVQFDGVSAIDPAQCYYRGDSQGGIFGTSYMALSTDVTRGLLGEPGMPYELLLNRSVDFEPFFQALKLTYRSGRDIQIVLGLVQMLWDKTEPSGYAPYITSDMLPGTPKHDILIQAAIGDYQVTPLGAQMIARTVGAKSLKPVNRSIFGLEEADGPFTGSGFIEYSFGLPESPKTNTPPAGPEDDDPHDKVRKLEASHDITDLFLRTGQIKAFCDGPCDPE